MTNLLPGPALDERACRTVRWQPYRGVEWPNISTSPIDADAALRDWSRQSPPHRRRKATIDYVGSVVTCTLTEHFHAHPTGYSWATGQDMPHAVARALAGWSTKP